MGRIFAITNIKPLNSFADTGIKEISISASVKNIYKNAFANSSVKEVIFADGAKEIEIEEGVFSGCKSLSFVGNGEIKANTIDLAFFKEEKIGINAFNTQEGVAESLAKIYEVLNKGSFDLDNIFGDTQYK